MRKVCVAQRRFLEGSLSLCCAIAMYDAECAMDNTGIAIYESDESATRIPVRTTHLYK